MSALQTPPDVSHEVEALFREARRRRRRRWIGGTAVAAIGVALIGYLVVSGGTGGGSGGGVSSPVRPGRSPSVSVPLPAQSVGPGDGVVGRGPTVIDFSDTNRGWIASGGSTGSQASNPTIVHTIDGGQTWQRTPVPNLAVQNVDSATNYAFGGLVGIHFANARRGWFYQAGIGWQTNDAATRWTMMRLPVNGALVGLTSDGDDVWALIDTCPIDAVSCPQSIAKGALFHAISAPVLKWQRVGGALPAGYGVLDPGAKRSVIVAFGNLHYSRSVGKASGVSSVTSCAVAGHLEGGAVAGVCDGGGGGDASVSKVAVSDNSGATWLPLINGPPSTGWMGTSTTNGIDAVFYVTGGQTLWRTGTTKPAWQTVLQTQMGSTDEIFPIYMEGTHGYALISNGADAHWFETNDDGVSWDALELP